MDKVKLCLITIISPCGPIITESVYNAKTFIHCNFDKKFFILGTLIFRNHLNNVYSLNNVSQSFVSGNPN